MKFLRRAAVVTAALTVALTGLAVQPASAAGPDVYTTPGGQKVNGRLWNTTCEKYSSTVVRCTTEIWATNIIKRNGRYVQVTGWKFNNLTYLPSARAQWKGNPLATPGEHTIGGRNWRTECDTPATGRGACRSYIWSTQIAREGDRYVNRTGWVFNNLVRFAEGSVKPVTKIPAHVLDQSVLTHDGLGPLNFGGNKQANYAGVFRDLQRLGYVYQPENDCYAYRNSEVLDSRGISVVDLADVAVTKPGIKTAKGAEVGMTIGQIKALYGSSFAVVKKTNHAVTQYFGTVKVGERELQFRVRGDADGHGGFEYAPDRPLKDSDKVFEISAQRYLTDVSFDGC